MVTRKPVPSRARAIVPQVWQTPDDRPYAVSSASDQATTPHPRGSNSPSTSPNLYEMNDPWADEVVERRKALGKSGPRRSAGSGRQSPEVTRVQEENLSSSLRTGPSEASQRTAEESQRFNSLNSQARWPTTADADEKQQYSEETGRGTNPFNGISRGTNVWQCVSREEETLALIWRDMPTPPVASLGAPPPPLPAENKTGVLLSSIRAFVNAEVVGLS